MGRIRFGQTPDELYEKPNSKEVAVFFGWKNILPAKSDGEKVSAELGEFSVKSDIIGDSYLAVRPDAVIIKDGGRFKGKILKASYMGMRSQYVIESGNTQLSIDTESRYMHLVGDEISFDIDESRICVIRKDD